MNSLSIAQPRNYYDAAALLRNKTYHLPMLKAGGMDVVDHLKEGLYQPDLLINVRTLRSNGVADPIRVNGDIITIEASATLAQIAESKVIRGVAPALAQAAESAATPQVRNIATAAGNLLQRPRCWYYRQKQFDCLKKGGDRCYAVSGENMYHAIFGGGPCHIVHPSNLAPAMLLGDALLHLTGGNRTELAMADLYHLPERGVKSEHNLEQGEVVTHITMKSMLKSGFAVVKEKQSFDWPLVFAVASIEMNGDVIGAAKVVAGAVAPVPWRLQDVETALKGVNVTDEAALAKACALSISGAQPMSQNSYKLKLLPVVVKRAVVAAAGK